MRGLLHRFQLLCAGALKHVQEMEGFCFEVEMRTGRPPARVAAKTNDLAAFIGACWGTSVEMAVSRLDACPSQMKRPSVGGCPATPTDPVMGGTHRATHTTGDIQGWMVLFTPWVTTPDIGTSNAANRPSKQSKRESEENLKTQSLPPEKRQHSRFSLTPS